MAQIHKVGIIGYGGMGRGWHPERMKDSKRAQVIAAYDINPKKVELAREDGLIGCDTLEELLAIKEIDLIVVATPNNFHKPMSIAAMRAGKNVICEKPVMMNAADLEEVIKVRNETGMLFSAHQNRRWDKDFLTMKKVVEDGTIGHPFFIESRVIGSRGIPGDWRCVAEAGGGMVYDWGVHLIDQLMWMIDKPVTEIYCQGTELKYEGVDDNFKLMLKFGTGKDAVNAMIEIGTYCFLPVPRWLVQGDAGSLLVKDWQCHGKVMKSKTLEMKWEEGVVWTSGGPTKTMAPRPIESVDTLKLPNVKADVVDFTRNVLDAIEGKAEQIVKPEQSLRVMKVIDAAFRSMREGICIKGEF